MPLNMPFNWLLQKQRTSSCPRLLVLPGRRPVRPTTAAEAGERDYCYRAHSEWALLEALHAQLDHLTVHERRQRIRLLQASSPTIASNAFKTFTEPLHQDVLRTHALLPEPSMSLAAMKLAQSSAASKALVCLM